MHDQQNIILALYNRISVSSTRTSCVLTMGTILHNIDYAEQYFWHKVPT